MPQRLVVIVDSGNGLAESLTPMIESLSRDGLSGKVTTNVRVVPSIEAAGPMLDRVDFLILTTGRGVMNEAERVKTLFRDIKVVVLTATLPEREVIVIDKAWLNRHLLEDLILR